MPPTMTSPLRIVDSQKIKLDDISTEEDSCAVLQLYSCVNVCLVVCDIINSAVMRRCSHAAFALRMVCSRLS
jgi:hypothetical protein